jgi:hypothetical protein
VDRQARLGLAVDVAEEVAEVHGPVDQCRWFWPDQGLRLQWGRLDEFHDD